MKNNGYEGSDRRTFFRIFYPSKNKAKLIVREHPFEIADISEGGIRIINDPKIKLQGLLTGKITFLYGESINIEGELVWEQNNQAGILLKDYIPPAMMEKEKQFVILESLKSDI